MPDTYEAKVLPQVAPSVDIPMAVTPQALGAGVGQAVQGLGETATQVYLRNQEHANQTAVLEADTRKQQFLNQRLYDPKSGLFHQNLGKDAPAAVDALMAEYDKQSSEIEGGLSNEVQKAAFRQAATARRLDLQRQTGSYEATQLENHAVQEDKKSIAVNATAAVQAANFGDNDAAEAHILMQQAVIAQAGRRNHLGDDVIQQQQAEIASGTTLGIIHQLATSDQADAAQAWFDQHEKELQGDDLTKATAIVRASTMSSQAQGMTDTMVKDKDGKIESISSFMAKVEKNPVLLAKPLLRQRVTAMGLERIKIDQEGQQQDNRARYLSIYDRIKDPKNPESINDPAIQADLALLPPAEQDHLRASILKTSDPVYIHDLTLKAAQDPDGFLADMRSNSPAILAKVGKEEYDKLTAMEKTITEKGSLSDANEILTKEQVLSGALVAGGFIKGKGEADRTAPGAEDFTKSLQGEIDMESAAKKRGLTPPEMQVVADRAVLHSLVQAPGIFSPKSTPTAISAITPEDRDRSSRDLLDYAKASPAAAVEVERFRKQAVEDKIKVGVGGDLSEDQYNALFAQSLIIRNRLAVGDQAAAQRALGRYNQILRLARESKRPDFVESGTPEPEVEGVPYDPTAGYGGGF